MKTRLKLVYIPLLASICFLTYCRPTTVAKPETAEPSRQVSYLVRKCDDFEITGNGSHPEWNKSEWMSLTQLDSGGGNYESKFKVLASATGIYVLFQGEDGKITTKAYEDMDRIWNGDVFEVFFHADPEKPQYFEYEVNPLGKQLVLSLSILDDQRVSWMPFYKDNKNSYGVQNKVEVVGGPADIEGTITSWRAEIFMAYKSMAHMQKVPPESGTVWNANFCRLDYDSGKMVKWSWTPTIEKSFHELEKFRSIQFE